MHANALAYVGGASAVQAERNSGFIKISVETRRSLECSNIELVRIFERDFGFVGDGLGHGTGHLLCSSRLIEHPHRGDYDLDQLRAELHPPKSRATRPTTPTAGHGLHLRHLNGHLRRLNGPQIKQERTRVLTRETKRRHIRMANHQPFAQPLHERIKIHAAIERAEGGGANVRTLTALADGMTLRAHSFCKNSA